jgi:hypothetical protein
MTGRKPLGKRAAMRAAKIAVLEMLEQAAQDMVAVSTQVADGADCLDLITQAEADQALMEALARRWGLARTPQAPGPGADAGGSPAARGGPVVSPDDVGTLEGLADVGPGYMWPHHGGCRRGMRGCAASCGHRQLVESYRLARLADEQAADGARRGAVDGAEDVAYWRRETGRGAVTFCGWLRAWRGARDESERILV